MGEYVVSIFFESEETAKCFYQKSVYLWFDDKFEGIPTPPEEYSWVDKMADTIKSWLAWWRAI